MQKYRDEKELQQIVEEISAAFQRVDETEGILTLLFDAIAAKLFADFCIQVAIDEIPQGALRGQVSGVLISSSFPESYYEWDVAACKRTPRGECVDMDLFGSNPARLQRIQSALLEIAAHNSKYLWRAEERRQQKGRTYDAVIRAGILYLYECRHVSAIS